jgi:hypothetical protein
MEIIRNILFGKPGQKPSQRAIDKQKEARERRKSELRNTRPREQGPAIPFPLPGGREAAQDARTFREFRELCIQEGFKKQKRKFNKAAKKYDKMLSREAESAIELAKETEPGSKARKKQNREHLLPRQGAKAFVERQQIIDRVGETARNYRDAAPEHKRQKAIDKVKKRLNTIHSKYQP